MGATEYYRKAIEVVCDLTGVEEKDIAGKRRQRELVDARCLVVRLLRTAGLENNIGYNFVYVLNMSMADYLKKSIEDEEHLAKHVKAIIDDIDENPENLFRMWIAKMDGNGIPIPWEDIM